MDIVELSKVANYTALIVQVSGSSKKKRVTHTFLKRGVIMTCLHFGLGSALGSKP
jgi:hypothetical protein